MSKQSMKYETYRILGSFSANGYVDNDDIIGSFYGQLEGILPKELNLAILNKSGKIGRIEFYIDNFEGRSTGVFRIPTSLDKKEVALVAAALESVEQLGHTKGVVKILDICNVCESKQKNVESRAAEFLKKLEKEEKNQLSQKEVIKKDKIIDSKNKIVPYLKGKCFGTKNIKSAKEIILVEGKADVSNLIKHGYDNIISCNGSDVPQEIKGLVKNKKIIAFLDNDKGGRQLLDQLKDMININFFIFSPKGKEVEELNKLQIKRCMDFKDKKTSQKKENKQKIKFTKEEREKLEATVSKLNESSEYIILNLNMRVIQRGKISAISSTKLKKGEYLLLDGIYEKSLDNRLKESSYKYIISRRKSNLSNPSKEVILFSYFQ